MRRLLYAAAALAGCLGLAGILIGAHDVSAPCLMAGSACLILSALLTAAVSPDDDNHKEE